MSEILLRIQIWWIRWNLPSRWFFFICHHLPAAQRKSMLLWYMERMTKKLIESEIRLAIMDFDDEYE